MAKRKTVVPFRGTAEQEKQLKELIASHKDMQGALMPVLQQAQEIYGYLPIEVQTMIAEGLGIPLEEVFGVATFYGQFTLNP
jgi:NADP-reducing hydrogenase subunit HndA